MRGGATFGLKSGTGLQNKNMDRETIRQRTMAHTYECWDAYLRRSPLARHLSLRTPRPADVLC